MKVLQILPSLEVGGVETGVVDLARFLTRHGHTAIVVSNGGELVKDLESAGARHYTLPVHAKSLISMIAMIRRLSGIIRDEKVDIVHARSRIPAWIAFFACRINRVPFITTAHGYYSKHFMSESMAWGKLVIVASNVMAKHMTRTFSVPVDRIRFIPRGVDIERFPFRRLPERSSNDFTVGMIARITPLKGHAHFIKAVSIAYRSVPRLKVMIVGEAPKGKERYRQELDLLTKRLGLTRVVEFVGAHKDVPAVLAKLDALVSATVTPEAFGRSIIEAQASGVPVIATAVGGVVDIVEDGISGILVHPEDPKQMAEAIIRLSKDRRLGERLAENGRKKVEERFTLDEMGTRTIAVYEEALKVRNVLIIKMGSIGDCILSMPSIRAVRSAFTDARVKVLVGLLSRDVFNNCPYIDGRIVCDFHGLHKGLLGFLALNRELARENFDITIDLQNNKKSHIISFLSLAPDRYGYRDRKYGFLLNRGIRDERSSAADPVEHQFRVLRSAGMAATDTRLELFPSENDDQWAREFLEKNWVKPSQRLIGMNIRASLRWTSKNWPIQFMAALSDRVAAAFNMRVVVTGSKDDMPLADEFSSLTQSKPVVAAGKTSILQLASLMKRCSVFVTPDSAPLHIATSLKVPVVALFGPTDPSRHVAPFENCVVIWKRKPCSPCYHAACHTFSRCMEEISVEEVFEAVERLINRDSSFVVRGSSFTERITNHESRNTNNGES